MSIELRPCPFCGETEGMTYVPFHGEYEVRCSSCQSRGPSPRTTSNHSIEAWNTRPIEDALNNRIAELESKNQRLRLLLAETVFYVQQSDYDTADLLHNISCEMDAQPPKEQI